MTIKAQDENRSFAPSSRTRRRWIRKAYLLPAEHGSWSWLLVPYIVGAAVAPQWSFASLLVLVGGLSAFLLRQPASAWLRIRQGRGRRSDEPVTLAWTALFLLLSVLSLAGLFILQRLELLWLTPPIAVLFVAYVAVAKINRAQVRNLWMELAGAAGLAVMAPAAYVAGSGQLTQLGWLLWLLLAIQNCVGVLYVRLRIADSHKRAEPRVPVLLAHLLAAGGVAAALVVTDRPILALVPFVAFLIRAAWVTLEPRPIANIKRFGFVEVGAELLSGLWLAFVFLLP